MKGKAEFNQQIVELFFSSKSYFFKSETKKVAYMKVLGKDLKILFFLTFKTWLEIKLVILLSWIHITVFCIARKTSKTKGKVASSDRKLGF